MCWICISTIMGNCVSKVLSCRYMHICPYVYQRHKSYRMMFNDCIVSGDKVTANVDNRMIFGGIALHHEKFTAWVANHFGRQSKKDVQ